MNSACCEQCRAPVSDTATFCLKCGARAGRRPARSFSFLSVLFFALIGLLLASILLSWLAARSSWRVDAASPASQRSATVVADSFCSESDTQMLQIYALIAQADRNAAAALVLRDSRLAVRAGTAVHEYRRIGRLSHVRVASSDAAGRTCWMPAIMLNSAGKRGAGPAGVDTAAGASPAHSRP